MSQTAFEHTQVTTHQTDNVIEIKNLTRRFGTATALDNVSLDIPRGSVFGIVGENGAGKTTLLRHMLGALKAQSGSVRILGLDPALEPTKVLSRVGYLSDAQDLPGWMRVNQLISYTKSFYPRWDERYVSQLIEMFSINPKAKVKHLSKGQNARVGLLLSLAYHPDVLLLDEPSSGLDPVVRRDILEAIIRSIADQGCTVVFSSHLLDEVERASEYVAMMCEGQLLVCDALHAIKQSYRVLTLSFEEQQTQAPAYPDALNWKGQGASGLAFVRISRPMPPRKLRCWAGKSWKTKAQRWTRYFSRTPRQPKRTAKAPKSTRFHEASLSFTDASLRYRFPHQPRKRFSRFPKVSHPGLPPSYLCEG